MCILISRVSNGIAVSGRGFLPYKQWNPCSLSGSSKTGDGIENFLLFHFLKGLAQKVSPFSVYGDVYKTVVFGKMPCYAICEMKEQKLYKLHQFKGRNIEAVFAHAPYKRVSTGTRDLAEAVLFCENYLRSDGIIGDTVPTFKDFAKSFFTRKDNDSLHSRDKAFGRAKRDMWYRDKQSLLDMYIIPRFGGYLIDGIKAVAIESWLVSVKGQKHDELSACTKRKILDCMRCVFDDAIRKDYISVNPARTVKPPVERSEPRRALTIYEQQQLFPADIDERINLWGSSMWALYFSIMYDTGFRPSEVGGLLVGNIYSTPQGQAVYTTHTINAETHKLAERVKTSGKGMESRVGLLSAPTQKLVVMFLEEIEATDEEEPLFLLCRGKKDSYVFNETANKHFKAVCKSLGITGVTQYTLRHTYATYRRGNVDETSLAIAMGHSNGVRNDYDHRTASLLIAQLENERERIFNTEQDKGIRPLELRKVSTP